MYKDSTPSSDKSLKTAVKGYSVENCGWLQLGGHLHTGTVCLSCEDIKKKTASAKTFRTLSKQTEGYVLFNWSSFRD